MAYSKAQWDRAKFLFELGYSLREIEEDCDISHVQISRKAKQNGWEKVTEKQSIKADVIAIEKENVTIQAKKVTVSQRVATLSDFEITILDEKVTQETGLSSLILNTQALAVIRANESLTRGTKTVMLKERQYSSEGVPIGEEYTPYDVALDSSDIKNHVEAVDKASLTLKVNDRHAPKNDISLTNAVQNNFTPNELTSAIAEALPN